MWTCTIAIAVEVLLVYFVTNTHSAYVKTAITDGTAKFLLGNDYGVHVTGKTSLTFETKSCGNSYFLLAEKIKVSQRRGNYYFISLGVTKSHRISGIIEGCYACNTFHNYKLKTVLNCTEFRRFTVTWDGQGSVSVYQGNSTKGKPLLQYKGKKKYPINYFHVTSFNQTAEWRFHLPCPDGTYGVNCTSGCGNCKCGSQCDPENGWCKNGCQPGWTGHLCKKACSNNTYGPNCTSCGQCRDDVTCDVTNGRCPGGRCRPGWVGDKCDRECPVKTYGPYCRPCAYCVDDTVCDRVTGHCPSQCEPGWTGEKCDLRCPQMTHGQNCTSCGHCLGEDTCHVTTGHCSRGCDPGWTGHLCKQQCQSFTYGHKCSSKCGACENNAMCSHVTGVCPYGCEAGWYGSKCNRACPSFTFGSDCKFTCGRCFNRTGCNQATGACVKGCEKGWTGDNCDNVDIPIEIRMTTEYTRDGKREVLPAPLRADTIVSIVLGLVIALLMGVLIMLLWRRAVTRSESKYLVNYSSSDTKHVQLDVPEEGNASFENPGYLNMNGNQSTL